jgi:HEAT repeat protein
MHEMQTADDARAQVRRLIGPRDRLPGQTRRDILDLGLAAVPALLEILEDEKLALTESPGEGWAPVYAARLLGELKAEEAVEPMLRALGRTDPLDILHDQALQALPNIGTPVLEPALRAHKNANHELQTSIASVLSRIHVHDERVFQILVAQLRR